MVSGPRPCAGARNYETVQIKSDSMSRLFIITQGVLIFKYFFLQFIVNEVTGNSSTRAIRKAALAAELLLDESNDSGTYFFQQSFTMTYNEHPDFTPFCLFQNEFPYLRLCHQIQHGSDLIAQQIFRLGS